MATKYEYGGRKVQLVSNKEEGDNRRWQAQKGTAKESAKIRQKHGGHEGELRCQNEWSRTSAEMIYMTPSPLVII